VKKLIFIFLLLCPGITLAQPINFYFIHPGGEGDDVAAKPYLTRFFAYLTEQTQKEFSGKYVNDVDTAVKEIKRGLVEGAIVSPKFFEKYKNKFKLKEILKTTPSYSNGPYEKYYILAHKGTDVTALDKADSVDLYSSRNI